MKPLKLDIMKNLLFFCILLVVGCMMFSCKGGLDPVDPPVAKKFTVTAIVDGVGGKISPSSVEVASGTQVELIASPDPGFVQKTISLNGSSSPLTSKNYIIPTVTTNYEVKVTFEKTISWIFMQNSWIKDSVYIYEPKNPQDQTLVWKYYAIPSAEADVVTFLPDGTFSVIVKGTKGDGPWSVDQTTNPPTLIWGEGWKIENISSNSFRIYKDNFKDVYKKFK